MLASEYGSEAVMAKRIAVLIIVLLLSIASLSSSPEFWLGASLRYDMNSISNDWKQYFPAYNDGRISFINSGGLNADFLCFWSPQLRLGLFTSLDMLFPVGYVADGGGTEGYISYKFDYRMDLTAGLAYYHMISPRLGLFAEAGMGYSFYRIAVTNDVNERDPGESNQFGEWIALADLGIVSVYHNSFFRFYASFSYSILTSGYPFRVGIGAGGGFIF